MLASAPLAPLMLPFAIDAKRSVMESAREVEAAYRRVAN